MNGVAANPLNLGKKSLWLSWEKHRRSQSLAARLGVPLFEFESKNKRWLRHPVFAIKTLALLLRKRPSLLFVQNPSVVLTLLVIIIRPFFRYRLIVDAHNAGIYPFERGHEKYAFLFPFMHRKADITIVTNKILAEIVEKNKGTPVVLPDPLPDFPVLPDARKKDESLFIVTYICSYASDEPYEEVFKAAAMLPKDVKIVATGNCNKLTDKERELAESNGVIFTGFLSDEDYLQQLVSSDCIMVLTEYDDCMVCGAYEAVALEKPLILSETRVLRWWFEDYYWTFFVRNRSEDINFAINSCFLMLSNEYRAGEEYNLKSKIESKWKDMFNYLVQLL